MELTQFIDQLRSEGSVDSEGQFTLGFADARRKLTQYTLQDSDRYLLLLVSAAVALGARAIFIERDDFELRFQAEGVYLSTHQIRQGFESLLAQGGSSAALDLALGLNGAFMVDALEVEVESRHPEKMSFVWTLNEAKEDVRPLESLNDHKLDLVIRFQKRSVFNRTRSWLRQAGGHSVVGRESTLVAKACEFSLVDLYLNGEPLVSGMRAPRAPVACLVEPERLEGGKDRLAIRTRGEPGERAAQLLRSRAPDWFGLLSLAEGELSLIIHGVTYQVPQSFGVSGVVYCDRLERDLSREKIVENSTLEQLAREIDDVRLLMVEKLRFDDVKPEWKAWVAEQARDLASSDRLGSPLLVAYSSWLADNPRWLKAHAGIKLAQTRQPDVRDRPELKRQILEQALADALSHLGRVKQDLPMLELVIEILGERGEQGLWDWSFLAGLAALEVGSRVAIGHFEDAVASLRQQKELGNPVSKLSLPIALLGLGYAHFRWGEQNKARQAWNQAAELEAKNPMMKLVDSWTAEPQTAGLKELRSLFWDLAGPGDEVRVCNPEH